MNIPSEQIDRPLLPKSKRLLESANSDKVSLDRNRVKQLRQMFNDIAIDKLLPVERLGDLLMNLGHKTDKDLRFEEFLQEYELLKNNHRSSGSIDFEHFVLLSVQYEKKRRVEQQALRNLDLKNAFEFLDNNKDGMIDKDEIYDRMNSLGCNITEREAEAMIEVADLDRDGLLTFEEFITFLAQVSIMNQEFDLLPTEND